MSENAIAFENTSLKRRKKTKLIKDNGDNNSQKNRLQQLVKYNDRLFRRIHVDPKNLMLLLEYILPVIETFEHKLLESIVRPFQVKRKPLTNYAERHHEELQKHAQTRSHSRVVRYATLIL